MRDSWFRTADGLCRLSCHFSRRVQMLACAVLAWAMVCFPLDAAFARKAARAAPDAPSYTLHGHVVAVYDGDSFTLLAAGRRQRVRMASIDAPELAQTSRERQGQPYARAARDALRAMIADKTLTLACFETDSYGRHVCDAPLEPDALGTRTANQRMVALGMAWANRQQARFLRDPALDALERTARTEKRGLWRDSRPVAPWVWRDQCWKRRQCH